MGTDVTLTCNASGAGNLKYQWMRAGKKTIPSRALGVNSSTLIIPNIMVEDRGKYQCVVSSGGTSVTSRPGTVSVLSKLLTASLMYIHSYKHNALYKEHHLHNVPNQLELDMNSSQ